MTAWKALLFAAAVVAALPMPLRAETPQEMVANADKIRNPGRPFRTTTTLIAYKSGQPVDKSVFTVFSKVDPATGQFRDIVVYVDPPRDAGKIMLFNKGFLWFYDPASKDSVRISPQQQLIGQANAGDVLTVNFAVDYKAALVDHQTIQDANGAARACAHINLTPANDDAIYNRIEYWVAEGSDLPIKAKFYSDSGRLLKVLYYIDFKPGSAGAAPSRAIILDSIDSSLVTTVDFSTAHFQDIPDFWFQRDYLPNVKTD